MPGMSEVEFQLTKIRMRVGTYKFSLQQLAPHSGQRSLQKTWAEALAEESDLSIITQVKHPIEGILCGNFVASEWGLEGSEAPESAQLGVTDGQHRVSAKILQVKQSIMASNPGLYVNNGDIPDERVWEHEDAFYFGVAFKPGEFAGHTPKTRYSFASWLTCHSLGAPYQ